MLLDVSFGNIITQILGWLGSVVDTIVSDRSLLLLIPFGIAVVGAVVGVLKRVFSGGKA